MWMVLGDRLNEVRSHWFDQPGQEVGRGDRLEGQYLHRRGKAQSSKEAPGCIGMCRQFDGMLIDVITNALKRQGRMRLKGRLNQCIHMEIVVNQTSWILRCSYCINAG